MPREKTNQRILEIAHELRITNGLAAVSFDAIARRLGISKQAVLYWYPTKQDLLTSLLLDCLAAETEAATKAVSDASDRTEAIGSFVRAIANFHFRDLDRYRMMYLLPQTTKKGSRNSVVTSTLSKVHPVTDRLYTALAAKLQGDDAARRREAVAIHSAVLGLVLMFALADSLLDPLRHTESDLAEALIGSLTAN